MYRSAESDAWLTILATYKETHQAIKGGLNEQTKPKESNARDAYS